MKKNVLALSITAALVGLGFAGGAQAIGLNNAGTPIPSGAADQLISSVDGIGHFLVVPYFSAQGKNTTMFSIVNTDTKNAKAVKVRFRGASNSDDLLDFQVFLSPGDIWNATVSVKSDGIVRLGTPDTSCTKPTKAVLEATDFSLVRLDSAMSLADKLKNTREGYIEIFNMANIPPNDAHDPKATITNPLYTAVKHISGVPNSAPPCGTTPETKAAWLALDSDPDNIGAAYAKGLYEPTTGLAANWIILDPVDGGAWSGAAQAIVATDLENKPTTGAVVYFPQKDDQLSSFNQSRINLFTADPVLIARPDIARAYDLPDFSIPYTKSSLPKDQAASLSQALATSSVLNEYATEGLATDWVLSMPTRRYSIAYDYKNSTVRTTTLSPNFFDTTNTVVIGRQICLKDVAYAFYDREETEVTDPGTQVVPSPQPEGPGPSTFPICGEANVTSFNVGASLDSGALQAAVARTGIDTAVSNVWLNGWAYLSTPSADAASGLPIIGYSALRATTERGQGYGATIPHRTDRVIK